MKRNKEKKAGLDAACSWDDADTQDALYPKRLFSVPDISYPDPKTAYQGFMDERSVMERIESYFHALRPYFLRAMKQADQDVAQSAQKEQD
ncbi:MAG: hypothetical protein OXU31_00995 [Gammaproteobacteria bacterium]|nr:hypothetical protein [Gammaproteobacteria bacterium]MDD9800104.1 hypothetical protein [Gammaproteobacteria bacterium]MDD9814548.1 hypothetical protein [Gammaproteobacteria bacterium]MDD9850838.1 hypothetical protein [Gammaproteobacteria bacterium]MDD9871293.1 hypothetical protein [Gammaproteobacteria bacterium]